VEGRNTQGKGTGRCKVMYGNGKIRPVETTTRIEREENKGG
jgi:hypothetical protein